MAAEEIGAEGRANRRVLYTDVDGTLTWRGGLMLQDSTNIFDALLRARRAGIDVVPVSGRGRVQVRELCRLLGFPRGIGELGCMHVDDGFINWEFGDFKMEGRTPVDVMHDEGLLDLLLEFGDLKEHEPWNEGRRGTLLVRGHVDIPAAEAALAEAGAPWCQIVDNGLTRNDTVRVYHLMPRGANKAYGVRRDLERYAIAREDSAYIGDSRADVACSDEVGQCWLVSNADPSIVWPHRTQRAFGDGVAELIDHLIG